MAITVFILAETPVELFTKLSLHPDLDNAAKDAAATIAIEMPTRDTVNSPIWGGPNSATPDEYSVTGSSVRFVMGPYTAGKPIKIEVGEVAPGLQCRI